MRTWGKDIAVGFGLAELLAVIVWAAGGSSDKAQLIAIVIVWPLGLMGAREARAKGWRLDQRISPPVTTALPKAREPTD